MTKDQVPSPAQIYAGCIEAGRLDPDIGQSEAIYVLDRLFHQLKSAPPALSSGRFIQRLFTPPPPPKGVYIHGGVGRGKTMLMDLFAKAVDPANLQRLHFHDFMVAAQEAIQAAREAGAYNPIEAASSQLISAGHIICFDEMEVRDIADAMIVQRLFGSLWNKGMVLVTTSNRAPDGLYLGGLHRDRFLPFIEQLNKRLHIHKINDGQDWRERVLQTVSSWYLLPNGVTHALDTKLDDIFNRLVAGQPAQCEQITIAGRKLTLEKIAGDLVDVQFDALCRTALGARDYLVLADRFSGMMMRNIPIMGNPEQNEARRFMWLVDALYDRGRFLIASAEAPQQKLYSGTQWAFEFERTCSRLVEMARFRGIGTGH